MVTFVVIYGDTGTGKLAIGTRLCKGVFEPYRSDLPYDFEPTLSVDGVNASLYIYITGGGGEFAKVRDIIISSAKGFIVVYAINCRPTFENAEYYCRNIIKNRGNQIPIVICGNKCDLEEERKISQFEGKRLAKKYGAEFIETSAKDDINIEAAFSILVRMMRKPPNINKQEKETCTTH
ncbi:small g-protein ras2 [Histomonas meleagridis]|nr:small g-protein ras2 [Histomonas meleagridis]